MLVKTSNQSWSSTQIVVSAKRGNYSNNNAKRMKSIKHSDVRWRDANRALLTSTEFDVHLAACSFAWSTETKSSIIVQEKTNNSLRINGILLLKIKYHTLSANNRPTRNHQTHWCLKCNSDPFWFKVLPKKKTRLKSSLRNQRMKVNQAGKW